VAVESEAAATSAAAAAAGTEAGGAKEAAGDENDGDGVLDAYQVFEQYEWLAVGSKYIGERVMMDGADDLGRPYKIPGRGT
jgi:hypothetical protein